MRSILVAAAVLVVAVPASAGSFPGTPVPTARTVVVNPFAGTAVPAVTKLHPVVGSVQRTGHFTNPFTHKTKHSNTVYNPVLGQFSKNTFRR